MKDDKYLEERVAAKMRKLINEREMLAIRRNRIEQRICEIDRVLIQQNNLLDIKV
jgi:hypothetical protein